MSTQPDDLADVGPFGPLTAIGWERANLETRSRAIVAESQMRIAGAGEAIISVSINIDEGRQAALIFVAQAPKWRVSKAMRPSEASMERKKGTDLYRGDSPVQYESVGMAGAVRLWPVSRSY